MWPVDEAQIEAEMRAWTVTKSEKTKEKFIQLAILQKPLFSFSGTIYIIAKDTRST